MLTTRCHQILHRYYAAPQTCNISFHVDLSGSTRCHNIFQCALLKTFSSTLAKSHFTFCFTVCFPRTNSSVPSLLQLASGDSARWHEGKVEGRQGCRARTICSCIQCRIIEIQVNRYGEGLLKLGQTGLSGLSTSGQKRPPHL